MSRVALPRGAVRGLLACSVIIYTVLPLFGAVWHSVVPEHEHWFIGQIASTAMPHSESDRPEYDTSFQVPNAPPGTTIMHAASLVSALQSFAPAIGLVPIIRLYIAGGMNLVVPAAIMGAKQPTLAPPDPPPIHARV